MSADKRKAAGEKAGALEDEAVLEGVTGGVLTFTKPVADWVTCPSCGREILVDLHLTSKKCDRCGCILSLGITSAVPED